MLIVNNTLARIEPFIEAIRAIAAGTADAETVEALADIFSIEALPDRIVVDFVED